MTSSTGSDVLQIREIFESTAVYPEQHAGVYLTTGLLSEMGELANVIKKVVRGDYSADSAKDRILDEYGDVCWYAVMRGRLSDLPTLEMLRSWADLFKDELRAQDSMGEPLRGNASAACEYLGDAMLQLLEAERNDVEVVSDLGVVLGQFLGIDSFVFEDACSTVAKKLAGRQGRGSIRGDGDDR